VEMVSTPTAACHYALRLGRRLLTLQKAPAAYCCVYN